MQVSFRHMDGAGDRAAAASARLAYLVLACLAALLGCASMSLAGTDEVQIATGALKGVVSDGVASFKGIPFAAPPTGDRRWRPPAAAVAWDGVRSAVAFGPDCPQMMRFEPSARSESEDCLTVNVWAPASGPARNLPVMVWIYGGAFIGGAASQPLYDGTQFARGGVVFVSFNYRVGRLGFFAHPAITKSAAPGEMLGNYGLMDQIAALKWVRDNIVSFGGDPANVTIFGQSAGGASVNLLMLAHEARGLFAKAISQSGFPRWGGRPIRDAANSAEDIGVEFAAQAQIDGNGPDAARALRALPVDRVTQPVPLVDIDRTTPEPIVDGTVLADNVAVLVAKGELADVPMMVGGTSCDASIYREYQSDPLQAFGFAKGDEETLHRLYGDDDVRAAFLAMTDRIETEPVRYEARARTKRGQSTFVYHFSYVPPNLDASPGARLPGAAHAAELPYVFGALSAGARTIAGVTYPAASEPDHRLSDTMMSYWIAFAKTGDPNHAAGPRWPAFTATDENLLDFSSEGPVVRQDFRARELDWVESKLIKPSVW
jgi:para-nitrobenzyl esterase